ncbi:hypothetical protein AM493_13710 [Flavobacterium akiainvivens]|uniref:Uncharacterized protein n=1 Tax=Flavobacterium akiainvivens TaxID=1202724 RepID=A0A0M9VIS0_9FLAO|nr:hypothetical protein [Flavobacterium akiainvivens]KOS06970.1 hypothetical protein AM493_13710 [Flavobacterium akiainvivens]SFQ59847.1 hypothetical protein SAMN05444144_109137 [Flavobacterium akiainvivens]
MIDCRLIEGCKELRKKKKDTLKDKKAESDSVCLIDNSSNEIDYNVIEFENCVFKDIQSEYEKCDLGVETENDVFFIELKGSNNNKGLKQILATVESTKHCFKKIGQNKKPVQKRMNGILIVSKKEVPKNLDKITLRKLTNLLGVEPIIEQRTYTIKL